MYVTKECVIFSTASDVTNQATEVTSVCLNVFLRPKVWLINETPSKTNSTLNHYIGSLLCILKVLMKRFFFFRFYFACYIEETKSTKKFIPKSSKMSFFSTRSSATFNPKNVLGDWGEFICRDVILFAPSNAGYKPQQTNSSRLNLLVGDL